MRRWQPAPYQQFFRTSAQPCPYVDGLAERKIITELSGGQSVAVYNDLSRAGFRRSHSLAYRPSCPTCSACVPVRIVAAAYRIGRSARRVLKANADLSVEMVDALAAPEQYTLFVRYQRARHGDGDMAAMSYSDYRAMVEDSPLDTRLLTARDATGRLIAAALIDELDDGCSAVYSFFDPFQPQRGLGTWLVLQMIERVRRDGRGYVYLGYWIDGSAKMGYKSRFQPLECLGPNGWELLEVPVAAQ